MSGETYCAASENELHEINPSNGLKQEFSTGCPWSPVGPLPFISNSALVESHPPFGVEFACSPYACATFLLQSSTVQMWISCSKLPIALNVSKNSCLSLKNKP